jgi:hypothetical protein
MVPVRRIEEDVATKLRDILRRSGCIWESCNMVRTEDAR